MFDIGFWEIALIVVVALLVVGPKEFPALVRTLGVWLRRARGFVNEFKEELDREIIKSEELERRIRREAELAELHKVIDETKATIPVAPAAGGMPEEVKGGTPVDAGHAPERDPKSDPKSGPGQDPVNPERNG